MRFQHKQKWAVRFASNGKLQEIDCYYVLASPEVAAIPIMQQNVIVIVK